MRRQLFLLAALVAGAAPLAGQGVCPGFNVVVNTPEDQLMLAVNGADTPQEQAAALDKFIQEHADSKFIPCAYEYEVMTNVKLNNFDKAIEYGEKDLANNYKSVNLLVNLAKAYVGAGRATDAAFQAIDLGAEQIRAELAAAPRPANVSDEEWKKSQAESVKDDRDYLVYAFFTLLQRVDDAAKRLQYLDAFAKAYPEMAGSPQLNFQYLVAYERANNPAKASEYGEKAIAADPNDIDALNLVAYNYALRLRSNYDKAASYAQKVLALVPSSKKPEGMTDAQFKTLQNNQLGMAHLTLGYVNLVKAGKTHRVASAIQEFKTAAGLLGANPELLGQDLYFLGYAYEDSYPANHRAAADALARASSVASSMQGAARELLAKVKKAE